MNEQIPITIGKVAALGCGMWLIKEGYNTGGAWIIFFAVLALLLD